MPANPDNENAARVYIEKVSQIQMMLTRLEKTSKEFFDQDPYLVHWGNVGDVNYLADELRKICNRVYKEGEHAI